MNVFRLSPAHLVVLFGGIILGGTLDSPAAPHTAIGGEILSTRGAIELAQYERPEIVSPQIIPPMPPVLPPGMGGRSAVVSRLPSFDASPCAQPHVDWLVSTRCSRQDWCDSKPAGVVVYVRRDGCKIERSSLAEMRAQLRPDIATSVFTHGSYVSFDDFVYESEATSKWLRSCNGCRPLQTVFFTWPSDTNARYLPGGVRSLEKRAEFNAFALAETIAMLPNAGRITVMGHSHGALMTTAAMHLLGGGSVQGRTSPARIPYRANVVLAAAAMDHDWLCPRTDARALTSLRQTRDRGRYGRALCVTQRMLILKSHHDVALKISRLRRALAKPALGRVGLTRCDERKMLASLCRVHVEDVTEYLGCKHIWPYYLQHREIACSVGRYLH